MNQPSLLLSRLLLTILFLSTLLSPTPTRNAAAAGIPLTGQILNENGDVADVPAEVRALSAGGSESYATLSVGGSYTLNLSPGTWWVRAVPNLDSGCFPTESPRQVIIPIGAASATQDLRIALADRFILGRLVDPQGLRLDGLRGQAFVLVHQDGRWLQPGPSVSIFSQGGVSQFLLPVASSVATQYVIHAALLQDTGYTQVEPGYVDLNATTANPIPVVISLAANTSRITGRLIDRATSKVKTGLPALVFGGSNTGAVAQAQVSASTGSYQIRVANAFLPTMWATNWWLHAFTGPGTGYAILRPRVQQVYLPYSEHGGSTVTADFTVARIDATIDGYVYIADETPVYGSMVSVASADGGDYHSWTIADNQGYYRLAVPAGKYRLRADGIFAHPGPSFPSPITVEVAAGQTITAPHLKFRGWDGNVRVTGTVTYKGSPRAALVRAYSDSGARASTQAGADGKYSLPAPGGETWHIQAASASAQGALFLISPRTAVVSPAAGTVTLDLALQANEPLIETGIFRINASADQVLTLSNGGQIFIPAQAITLSVTAASDMAAITVLPLPGIEDGGGIEPVSFGYRLLAFDASGAPVTRFNAPVTLRLPFTGEQLAGQGLGPDQLIPCSYDPTTASWIPLPNFSIEMEPDLDGDGVVVIQVNQPGDFVDMVDSLPYRVSLPAARR